MEHSGAIEGGKGHAQAIGHGTRAGDRGRHEGIALDGLKFALVIRSGPVMADGGWVFGVVVDETASEPQRRALAAIVGGTAGGPPQMIRDNLVGR